MNTANFQFQKWLGIALYAVPIFIASLQIFHSNFSDLTRWKGGGFGMYTEMYPENRSIWLVTQSTDSTLATKIYPISLQLRGQLDPPMREVYRQMRPEVRNLLHFPSGFDFNSPRMTKTREILVERHLALVNQAPLSVRVEVQAVEFSLQKSVLESILLKSKEL
jgi:hypothetical protein